MRPLPDTGNGVSVGMMCADSSPPNVAYLLSRTARLSSVGSLGTPKEKKSGWTLTSHPREEPLSPRQCILDPPATQEEKHDVEHPLEVLLWVERVPHSRSYNRQCQEEANPVN